MHIKHILLSKQIKISKIENFDQFLSIEEIFFTEMVIFEVHHKMVIQYFNTGYSYGRGV